MMSRWCIGFLLVVAFGVCVANAHTLNLQVENENDGTLLVRGEFSTGQSAAGAMLKLQALASDQVLFQKRLPAESELVVTIPNQPYTIVLDGGPQHQVAKEGPPPPDGFSVKTEAATRKIKKISASHILWAVSFLLWGVAVFFGYRSVSVDA